jgi:hypothetical protein
LEYIGVDKPLGAISSADVAEYRDARLKNVTAYSVRLVLILTLQANNILTYEYHLYQHKKQPAGFLEPAVGK